MTCGTNYAPAECIASLVSLGAQLESDLIIPTYLGVVDQVLEQMFTELPVLVQVQLTFSDTGVGRRCLELPQVFDDIEYIGLGISNGDTFDSLQITCPSVDAYALMYNLCKRGNEAKALGRKFVQKVRGEMKDL